MVFFSKFSFFFFIFQAYNITNDEPIFFWEFLSRILVGFGYDAPKYHLPFMLIYFIAVLLQIICNIIRPIKDIKPTFTPMTVSLAGTHHYYSCERAKRDMGYKPIVPLNEAIKTTIGSFPYLQKDNYKPH